LENGTWIRDEVIDCGFEFIISFLFPFLGRGSLAADGILPFIEVNLVDRFVVFIGHGLGVEAAGEGFKFLRIVAFAATHAVIIGASQKTLFSN
jgi:hypothetical protein